MAVVAAPQCSHAGGALWHHATAMHDARQPAITLRSPPRGDMGWAVSRHGALYAQECGRDRQFEAMVGIPMRAGCRLVASKPHHCLGLTLVEALGGSAR